MLGRKWPPPRVCHCLGKSLRLPWKVRRIRGQGKQMQFAQGGKSRDLIRVSGPLRWKSQNSSNSRLEGWVSRLGDGAGCGAWRAR